MKEFEGKVVLITGASSGIGAAAAVDFAAKGASLALTGRNEERLQKTVAQCVENGCSEDQVLTIKADMSVEENVANIMTSTIEKFGKLDVLVNNAGQGWMTNLFQQDFMQAYDRTIRLDVRSWVQLTHLATPYLLKTKGCIVNNSSVCGLRVPVGPATAYALAKTAIDQFTKLLALDIGPKGVRANGLNPGCIMTPMVTKTLGANDTEDAARETLKRFHPIGRVGEVDDVVPVISFLASDGAKFMNGANVPVDGGSAVMCPR